MYECVLISEKNEYFIKWNIIIGAFCMNDTLDWPCKVLRLVQIMISICVSSFLEIYVVTEYLRRTRTSFKCLNRTSKLSNE